MTLCLHCGEPVENLLQVPYCSPECEWDHAQLMMDEADRCDFCGNAIDDPNPDHPETCDDCELKGKIAQAEVLNDLFDAREFYA